ncbi:MAG: tetratricopeptide repeat protein [Flavobacteriaceae bacterium]|nr:tetratricopeptide repeat protein [Flavobacteriaceae bacterium]
MYLSISHIVKAITSLAFLFFLSSLLSAQQNFELKIKEANRNIYENPNKAIEIGLELYNSTETNDEIKVNALMLISTAYSSKRNNLLSLEYANKSLELLPKIKNKLFKVSVLNKIGDQYHQLQIYDQSISYLDEALKYMQEINEKDSIANLQGYNYAVRGFVYREQMSCDIALTYFNKSIHYFQKHLKKNEIMNANISIINYNKGNCFLSKKQIDSADVSFDKAIRYAQVIKAKSLEGFAIKGMAEVLTIKGQYNEAISILEKGLSMSSDVGDLILNQGLYKGLADNYLAIKDWENYKFYNSKYIKTNDTIKSSGIKTINNSLSNLIKENTIELNQLQSKISLTKQVYITGFIFLLMFILQILYSYQKSLRKLKNIKQKISKEAF